MTQRSSISSKKTSRCEPRRCGCSKSTCTLTMATPSLAPEPQPMAPRPQVPRPQVPRPHVPRPQVQRPQVQLQQTPVAQPAKQPIVVVVPSSLLQDQYVTIVFAWTKGPDTASEDTASKDTASEDKRFWLPEGRRSRSPKIMTAPSKSNTFVLVLRDPKSKQWVCAGTANKHHPVKGGAWTVTMQRRSVNMKCFAYESCPAGKSVVGLTAPTKREILAKVFGATTVWRRCANKTVVPLVGSVISSIVYACKYHVDTTKAEKALQQSQRVRHWGGGRAVAANPGPESGRKRKQLDPASTPEHQRHQQSRFWTQDTQQQQQQQQRVMAAPRVDDTGASNINSTLHCINAAAAQCLAMQRYWLSLMRAQCNYYYQGNLFQGPAPTLQQQQQHARRTLWPTGFGSVGTPYSPGVGLSVGPSPSALLAPAPVPVPVPAVALARVCVAPEQRNEQRQPSKTPAQGVPASSSSPSSSSSSPSPASGPNVGRVEATVKFVSSAPIVN